MLESRRVLSGQTPTTCRIPCAEAACYNRDFVPFNTVAQPQRVPVFVRPHAANRRESTENLPGAVQELAHFAVAFKGPSYNDFNIVSGL